MSHLADIVVNWAQAQAAAGARVLYISGAQGIGKSTACAEIARRVDGACVISLDDFYLGKAERVAIAARMHPLCATRGAPGTHDALALVRAITLLREGTGVVLPVFDKAADDVAPRDRWRRFETAPSLIVVEGWMMGVSPDPAAPRAAPLNAVEAEDTAGVWRGWQEAHLAGAYARLWDMADAWLHIDAPGFDCVARWRMQQEETTLGLARGALPPDRRDWVESFIQHYERLTRRMLSGARRPGWRIAVDAARTPLGLTPQ